MKVPVGTARYDLEIKRSRFIAEIEGCSDRETAEGIIRQRRDEHPDAAHVVYAFSVGGEKNRQFGMSDDGEPKGTAGLPVLEVLKGSEITDCVLTIVRYFGGTKLGTGGLVHAYGDAAKGAIAALHTTEKRDVSVISFDTPYELHNNAKMVLANLNAEILDEIYTERIHIIVSIDSDKTERLQSELGNVSRGTLRLRIE